MSEPPASIVQTRPASAGNVSVTDTPRAVPVPGAALFVTVTTYPIVSPALTGVVSAVFVSESAGD